MFVCKSLLARLACGIFSSACRRVAWVLAIRPPSISSYIPAPAAPPTQPPTYLPSSLPADRPGCLFVCLLPVCLSACLPARLAGCLSACMHACMHACMYVCMYELEWTLILSTCILRRGEFATSSPNPDTPNVNPSKSLSCPISTS